MPELPEVETLRRSLEPHLVGRTVAAATLHRRDIAVAPGDPPGGFARQRTPARPRRLARDQMLAGAVIAGLERRGKQLAIIATDGRAIRVHLGMSGQLLRAARAGRLPGDHVHATWRLDDGGRLVFRDPRRFGGLWLVDAGGERFDAALGPDALAIGAAELRAALDGARRPIKAALLDQRVLAGVGNIYADESLFAARIHPRAIAAALDPPRISALAAAIRRTLASAVRARGSSIRDYRDPSGEPGGFQARHRVYGRAGLACHGCGRMLASDLVAQRTTVWCPGCQGTDY
ncbi:MAG: bifunctional DNA-formamidopyrimidine glycosylase/DNA-(apurinic or apyrimidinic site) lyase [Planctomycetota bacterium]